MKMGKVKNQYVVKILALFALVFLVSISSLKAKAADVREAEPNDTMPTANTINADDTYLGFLEDHIESNNFSGEMDCYKFKPAADGVFNVSFWSDERDSSSLGYGWMIRIYDNETLVYTIDEVKALTTTVNIPVRANEIYFIKISQTNAQIMFSPVGVNYKFKVNYTASDSWEKEDNNDFKSATQVKTNHTYYGNLYDGNIDVYKSGEADYYKFQLEETGYFVLRFGTNESKTSTSLVGDGWLVELYDVNKKLVYQTIAKMEQVTTNKFAMENGDEYYVKVSPVSMNADVCPSYVDYDLNIRTVDVNDYEVEENNTSKTATKINVNKLFYGTLYNDVINHRYGDTVDYFTFTQDQAGYFSITLGYTGSNNVLGDGCRVKLYSGKKFLYEMNDVKGKVTTPNFAFEPGTKFYVEVSLQDTKNMEKVQVADYYVKVNFKKSNYWEQEYNDKKTTANEIVRNKTYSGNISDDMTDIENTGETDYYCYEVSKDSTLKISFGSKNAPSSELGDGWNFDVYINKTKVYAGTSIVDKTKVLTTVGVEKGDVVWLKVTSANADYEKCPSFIDYSFKVK